jgi:hypothetical protein
MGLGELIRSEWRHRSIALPPELFCDWQRIHLMLQPPLSFVACGMDLSVVYGGEGDRALLEMRNESLSHAGPIALPVEASA